MGRTAMWRTMLTPEWGIAPNDKGRCARPLLGNSQRWKERKGAVGSQAALRNGSEGRCSLPCGSVARRENMRRT